MRFRESQARARKNTALLVAAFGVVVISTAAVTYVALIVGLVAMRGIQAGGGWIPAAAQLTIMSLTGFGLTALFVLGVIGIAALMKLSQLKQGGVTLAQELEARCLYSSSRDPNERRALNALEEIAIGQGCTAPPLFLLDDERGINAFALGMEPAAAAIILTKGAVKLLSRDEIQGVLAHEMAHIRNGDTRFNTLLIAILHGILMIHSFGRWIVRQSTQTEEERAKYERDPMVGSRTPPMGVLILGFSIQAAGSFGLFLGRIVKSAICRQREYLADASAVEYTRNPLGLSSSLKKIAALNEGSEVNLWQAEEFSHFFFGAPLEDTLSFIFSSHPPIERRIHALEPQWNGAIKPTSYAEMERLYAWRLTPEEEQRYHFTSFTGETISFLVHINDSNARLLEPVPDDYQKFVPILKTIPNAIISSSYEPYGARAFLYAVFLSKEPDVRDRQIDLLRRGGDWHMGRKLRRMAEVVRRMKPEAIEALVPLMLPRIAELYPIQARQLIADLDGLRHLHENGDAPGFQKILDLVSLHGR